MHNILNKSHGVLYVVATPIGNLNDITSRAISVLSEVDIIATEDTRHSKKLLNQYHIKTRQISYHKFNEKKRTSKLIDLLLDGKNIALISDAGTPSISDPGDVLIKEAHINNIVVSPIPGPSSVISAISASGFGSKPFSFIGFLPRKESHIVKILDEFNGDEKNIVFLESSKRILKTLQYLKKIYSSEKEILIAKEISKIYENITLGTIDYHMQLLEDKKFQNGEFVIIIPAEERRGVDEGDKNILLLLNLLLDKKLSYKDSINIISKFFKLNKNTLYKRFISLEKETKI
ncbi:MAG: 16S rRNA (cytidine(1402)-2'-O)-methyltransferase [Gammaproteobacteria bacterium]|nr:16S rRNA (cytidine(1402)-2'-O)-methyltransferase [Gammaproteobacteria bacterium]|tara:strand:+ start:4646 stop:5515 length:870 start_codon:yes stop_codon:yes gene_type:complete